MTNTVERRINTLKNSAKGSNAMVPINRSVTALPPVLMATIVRINPPNTHQATLKESSLR